MICIKSEQTINDMYKYFFEKQTKLPQVQHRINEFLFGDNYVYNYTK